MSQNDFIHLGKVKLGKDPEGIVDEYYEVFHADIEHPDKPFTRTTHKTLEGAVSEARKIQNEALPEYGISIGDL